MGQNPGGHAAEHDIPTEKKEDLYDLINEIEVCMFTTRRPDVGSVRELSEEELEGRRAA